MANEYLTRSFDHLLEDCANVDTGGGGGGYVAKAVHFDGSTYLENISLVADGDNTGFASFVCWVKCVQASFDSAKPIWVVDPENNYSSNGALSIGSPTQGLFQSQFCNEADTGCWSCSQDVGFNIGVIDGWNCWMVSVQTSHATGAKIFNAYLNDALMDTFISEGGAAAAAGFLLTFNGKSFAVFNDGNGPATGDLADFWFAPGQYIDFSVEANRRKFIDANGKPVDLGADGATPTGTAPAIFFSGEAPEFATNKGTGGSFVLTGSLTNATTSPSD